MIMSNRVSYTHHTCSSQAALATGEGTSCLQTSDTGLRHPSDQFTAEPCVISFRLQTNQRHSIIGEASTGGDGIKAEDFGERFVMLPSQFGILFLRRSENAEQSDHSENI